MSRWTALGLGILLVWSRPLHGQSSRVETGPAAEAHWRYLVTGWRTEREKLKNYELVVTGEERRFEKLDDVKPRGISKKVREINLEISRDLDGGNKKNVIERGDGPQSSGVWIQTPEYLIESVRSKSPIINLIQVTDRRQLFAIDLQPEVIGVYGFADITASAGKMEDQLATIAQTLEQTLKIASLTEIRDGVFLAAFRMESDEATFDEEISINEREGFSVVGRRSFSTFAKSGGGPGERMLDDEITTTWREIQDLWLPVQLSEINRPGLFIADASFDWRSLGKSLPREMFNVDAIGDPKGTLIVDSRLGYDKSIVVGHVGGAKDVITPLGDSGRFSFTTIALCSLAAATTFAFIGLAARRFARRDLKG